MPAKNRTMTDIGRELDAAEAGNNPSADTPGVMPPKGVPATVETKIRYNTAVDPSADSERYYSRELRELAAEEAERLPLIDNLPLDPLVQFVEDWANYGNGQYSCLVYRRPDPGPRRIPGNQYRRPYFGPAAENLGTMTFDANVTQFIADLQALNQHSGGCFQVYLVDMYGQRVPDAILHTGSIADPAISQQEQSEQQRQHSQQQQQQAYYQQQQQQPAKREETEEDREMREFRRSLMQTAMQRLLNPPAPPPAPITSALSAEEQAKLYLLQQAPGLFPTMFGQIAELQKQALEAATASAKEPTWKDRAIDAALQLTQSNPAIVDRLSGVAERIIARFIPDPRFDTPAALSPPTPPPQYLPPPPVPAPLPVQQELPDQLGELSDEPDEDIMDILDSFIGLLNSTREIKASDVVFIELQKTYPLKFKMAARMIATQPLPDIVEWVKTQNPLYESLLTSEVSGPHLQERIAELQRVFQRAIAASQRQQQPSRSQQADAQQQPETQAQPEAAIENPGG